MSSQFKFNPFTHKLDYTGTAAGPGNIVTIDGDTGSITGNVVTIFANQATKNCGQSVSFDNSGTISTMSVTDSGLNTIIGKSSGGAPGDGGQCVGLGFSNLFNNTGPSNVAIGVGILNGNPTTGSQNIGLGLSPLGSVTSGSNNFAAGFQSGTNITTGSSNVLIGVGVSSLLTTGSNNTIIGESSGSSYTGAESNNIIISNPGVLGENNTIHIGNQGAGVGQQNACFIAGIAGVAVASAEMVTIDSLTGQLGSTALPPAPFVWSDNSGTFTAASNNGYFITTTATPTLPAAPAEGDTVSFIVDTTNICTITANTGQRIRVGTTLSALAGTCASNFRGDSIDLVYRTTGATWFARSAPEGTWSVT